jgi:hypothetical protein
MWGGKILKIQPPTYAGALKLHKVHFRTGREFPEGEESRVLAPLLFKRNVQRWPLNRN